MQVGPVLDELRDLSRNHINSPFKCRAGGHDIVCITKLARRNGHDVPRTEFSVDGKVTPRAKIESDAFLGWLSDRP